MKWQGIFVLLVVSILATATASVAAERWDGYQPSLDSGRLTSSAVRVARVQPPAQPEITTDANGAGEMPVHFRQASFDIWRGGNSGYIYQPGSCDYSPPCIDHLWDGYCQRPLRCGHRRHGGHCQTGCGGGMFTYPAYGQSACGGCGDCNAGGCNAGGCSASDCDQGGCGCGRKTRCGHWCWGSRLRSACRSWGDCDDGASCGCGASPACGMDGASAAMPPAVPAIQDSPAPSVEPAPAPAPAPEKSKAAPPKPEEPKPADKAARNWKYHGTGAWPTRSMQR